MCWRVQSRENTDRLSVGTSGSSPGVYMEFQLYWQLKTLDFSALKSHFNPFSLLCWFWLTEKGKIVRNHHLTLDWEDRTDIRWQSCNIWMHLNTTRQDHLLLMRKETERAFSWNQKTRRYENDQRPRLTNTFCTIIITSAEHWQVSTLLLTV